QAVAPQRDRHAADEGRIVLADQDHDASLVHRARRDFRANLDGMSDVVLRVKPLAFPWETSDPFLFCVHHLDRYPAGNDRLGPGTSLAWRDLGQGFRPRTAWASALAPA